MPHTIGVTIEPTPDHPSRLHDIARSAIDAIVSNVGQEAPWLRTFRELEQVADDHEARIRLFGALTLALESFAAEKFPKLHARLQELMAILKDDPSSWKRRATDRQ